MNPHVFMDVEIDNEKAGRLVFEVYLDVVPKTALNVLGLCKGYQLDADTLFTYKGTTFHQIYPGFVARAGKIQGSIYAGQTFEDESFLGKSGLHTGFGCLAMCNSGRDSNLAEFYVCFGETPWLDGKHVVVGTLREGEEVLRRIETCGSKSGVPTSEVKIVSCGEITV